MRFEVLDEHIKLLKRMYINWDDSAYDGAPVVDIKRPYGNSDVIGDIAEILEWELFEGRYGDMILPRERADQAHRLHEQMDTVLEILVRHPAEGIKPGTYTTSSRWTRDWTRVEEQRTFAQGGMLTTDHGPAATNTKAGE